MRALLSNLAFLLLPSVLGFNLYPNDEAICMKPSCVVKAAELILNMNATADPCEDFYEFACGGFLDRKEIPKEEISVSNSFYPIRHELLKRGRALVSAGVDIEKDWDADIKAKAMFKSCMDMEKRNELGSAPLKAILTDILGGWPALEGESWDEESFDWQEALIKMQEQGLRANYIFDMAVGQDLDDSSKRTFYIYGPSLGISRYS